MHSPRRQKVVPIAAVRKRRRSQRNHGKPPRGPAPSPILIIAPLALLGGLYVWLDRPAPPDTYEQHPLSPGVGDQEMGSFAHCGGKKRHTCVVDGDTFWYEGEKIRIADINTPETSEPSCSREAALGDRATTRMTELLNEGPFSLEFTDDGRDTDYYGRALRVVTRNGESLGQILVKEGLAESWKGYRSSWC